MDITFDNIGHKLSNAWQSVCKTTSEQSGRLVQHIRLWGTHINNNRLEAGLYIGSNILLIGAAHKATQILHEKIFKPTDKNEKYHNLKEIGKKFFNFTVFSTLVGGGNAAIQAALKNGKINVQYLAVFTLVVGVSREIFKILPAVKLPPVPASITSRLPEMPKLPKFPEIHIRNPFKKEDKKDETKKDPDTQQSNLKNNEKKSSDEKGKTDEKQTPKTDDTKQDLTSSKVNKSKIKEDQKPEDEPNPTDSKLNKSKLEVKKDELLKSSKVPSNEVTPQNSGSDIENEVESESEKEPEQKQEPLADSQGNRGAIPGEAQKKKTRGIKRLKFWNKNIQS